MWFVVLVRCLGVRTDFEVYGTIGHGSNIGYLVLTVHHYLITGC